MQVGRAGVPDRDAVGATVFDEEIGGGRGGADKDLPGLRQRGGRWQRAKKLQFFGETEDCLGQTARPGAEGRVALLGVGTAIVSIIHIEDAFVRGTAAHIVGITALAIINRMAGGCFRVVDQPLEQGEFLVALPHENVAELVGHGQGTQ